MFNIFINFGLPPHQSFWAQRLTGNCLDWCGGLLHIIHLPFFKTQCPLVSLKDKGHPVKFRTS